MTGKWWTLIASLAVAAVVANVLAYEPYGRGDVGLERIRKIPRNMGTWVGTDVPLDEEIYRILETRAIIHRGYVEARGEDVFLSLVHYPEANVGFHGPEQCLGAQGIALEKARRNVRLMEDGGIVEIPVNQLVQEAGGQKILLYYFYHAGRYDGDSYVKMRLAVAVNKLMSHGTGGSLVRISTPIRNGTVEEAGARLKRFLDVLYPYLTSAL